MKSEESVFDQTYRYYLSQIREINLNKIAPILGATVRANQLYVRFFTDMYRVSSDGILGPTGKKPPHDICVILSKYLLMCPPAPAQDRTWVSFRDFKDSSPLIGYFANSVENAVAAFFSGRLAALEKASGGLGGYSPTLDVQYDYTVQFDALPMVSVVMLYNDTDEEFSAKCALLSPAQTEHYLDAECIAMIGSQLFSRLKQMDDR